MACLGHDASKCGTVAFDLWDDTLRLIDTLTARCPGPNEEIWKLIKGPGRGAGADRRGQDRRRGQGELP